MLQNYVKQVLEAKVIRASARQVGDSVNDQIERLWHIVHSVRKSISKGWSFFKDIYFGWFALVPVISSTSTFGSAVAILAWGSVIILVFVLIGFIVLDGLLGSEVEEGTANRLVPSARTGHGSLQRVPVAVTSHRARATYEPLQSRWTQAGLRRSGVRRAPRGRGSHN